MKEMTLRGDVLPESTTRVEVLTGFRYGGRPYGAGDVASFPGWFARQLLLAGRVREVPARVVAPVPEVRIEAPVVEVVAEVQAAPQELPARRVVEIRRVGRSPWHEVLVDGVVVGKRKGEAAAHVLAREHGA